MHAHSYAHHAAAPHYAAGGGFNLWHSLLSGAVHFAEWRILGAIVRSLGGWGIAFCVMILVGIFLATRRRAY